MRYFGLAILASSFVGAAAIAAAPNSYVWIRLLSNFDRNRDQQLSVKELGSYWNVIGKYDFNRNGQLTKQEFQDQRIPPAIKK